MFWKFWFFKWVQCIQSRGRYHKNFWVFLVLVFSRRLFSMSTFSGKLFDHKGITKNFELVLILIRIFFWFEVGTLSELSLKQSWYKRRQKCNSSRLLAHFFLFFGALRVVFSMSPIQHLFWRLILKKNSIKENFPSSWITPKRVSAGMLAFSKCWKRGWEGWSNEAKTQKTSRIVQSKFVAQKTNLNK